MKWPTWITRMLPSGPVVDEQFAPVPLLTVAPAETPADAPIAGHLLYVEHPDGALEAIAYDAPRDQRIHVDGVGYYHVREHRGVWVYRKA